MSIKISIACLVAIFSLIPMSDAAMCRARPPQSSSYGSPVPMVYRTQPAPTTRAPATIPVQRVVVPQPAVPPTSNTGSTNTMPPASNSPATPPPALNSPPATNLPPTNEPPYQSNRLISVDLYSGCSYVSSAADVPVYNEPQKDTILQYHNAYRTLFQSAPLQWDDALATTAYLAAQVLSNHCGALQHASNTCLSNQLRGYGGQGENLASGYSNWGDVINGWAGAAEQNAYISYPNQFSSGAGHFTQVVWKSTTKVGCAVVKSNQCGQPYYVCRYNPPGNFAGRFAQNVVVPTTAVTLRL